MDVGVCFIKFPGDDRNFRQILKRIYDILPAVNLTRQIEGLPVRRCRSLPITGIAVNIASGGQPLQFVMDVPDSAATSCETRN